MSTTYATLSARLGEAFDSLLPGADPALRSSDRADFQANGVMALAKSLGRPPREVAQDVINAVHLDGVAELAVAGPGFLNVTVHEEFLNHQLRAALADERLGAVPTAAAKRVVIDYSSPNVAKEMHVGHLRGTIIGDALARLYRFAGHEVIARNHVGDWGTPFGMLIEHLVDLGQDGADATLSIADLDGFYRDARHAFDGDEAMRERSRARVVALQSGDPETRRLWGILFERSVNYISDVYAKLNVTLRREDVVGESYYNDSLAGVVRDLDALGLLVDSDGAQCVFPPGFTNRLGEPLPLIVQKRDEGFGYAATDLAALRDRVEVLRANELIYVVGAPQAQHFEMIFAVARRAGWLSDSVHCEHVAFGHVLGTDHKMLKSRQGESVKLAALLAEAVERAYVALDERATVATNERYDLARAIALGAIKYADLSTERQHDYVFDLDRMVSFEGNTGPYLQYAHARVASIFRRAPEGYSSEVHFTLSTPPERALALALLAWPEAVAGALESHQPHRLCTYLFDLAQRFATFYDVCPVLKAPPSLRDERLALCDLSARALAQGLSLLGIDAPTQM